MSASSIQPIMYSSVVRILLAALACNIAEVASADFIAIQGRIQSGTGSLFANGDTFTAAFNLASTSNPPGSPGRFQLTAGALHLFHGSQSYVVPNIYATGYTSDNVTHNTGNITGIEFDFQSTASPIHRFHGELYSLYPQNSQITDAAGMILGNVLISSLVSNPWAFIETTSGTYNWMPIAYSLNSAPLITTQPSGGTYIAGDSFTLTVAAIDTSALSYQWYRNGDILGDYSNRTGSTSPTLTHTGIGTIGFDGDYTVRVTNASGQSTLSDVARVIVNKRAQTINFPSIPDQLATAGPFSVSATASSGFAVTYSVLSGPATIVGNVVTLTGAGSVTIRASQPGDLNFDSVSADQSFSVGSALAIVTIGGLSQTYNGTSRPATLSTIPSGLTVNVTYNGDPIAPTNAGTYTVVATVVDDLYSGNASGMLVISKAPLVARADDKTRTFATSNPALSISYSGFVNGETTAALTSEPSANTAASSTSPAGTYSITLSGGSAANYTLTLQNGVLTVTPFVGARLANISFRAYDDTGEHVTIGGFVIAGSSPKRLLMRAVGSTLTNFGLGSLEILTDPVIELHDASHGNSVIATNDNWGDNENAAEIVTTSSRVGAFNLASTDTQSAALLTSLQPGVYSFIARGKNATPGIVLIEVYDADPAEAGSTFVNVSARAYSTANNGVSIGGFVVSGNIPKRVLLRAVGPTLTSYGISATEVLRDPVIEVHDASHGNVVIATNDNWGDNQNSGEILTTGAKIGAMPLATTDTASSALLMTLQPGVYSFIASGKTGTSGIVLVEVYDAD